MQNIAATGRGSFRSGSGADKYMRMLFFGCGGSVGLYYWAKDSESAFWSKVFMPVYARVAMDEEWCHSNAVAWLRKGKGPFDYSRNSEVLATDALGKTLGHPLMLGAGLDRNGECVYGCLGLGFSGVEVGSVTPEKQAGNGMPRVFRIRSDETTISRAGAPNRGMAVVSYFLEQYRTWQLMDANRHRHTLVGVNVARNKVSNDILDDAKIGVKVLSDVADYIAINLPTPRLLVCPPSSHITPPPLRVALTKQPQHTRETTASSPKRGSRISLTLATRRGTAWTRRTGSRFCSRYAVLLCREPHQNKNNSVQCVQQVCLDMTEKDKKILKEVATEKKIDGLIVGQGTLSRPGMMEFHFLSRQNGLAYGRPTRVWNKKGGWKRPYLLCGFLN